MSQKRVGINIQNPKHALDVKGNTYVDSILLIGQKLSVKTGINSTIGEVVLVNGIAKVFTNKITKESKVFITYKKPVFNNAEVSIIYVPQDLIEENISFTIKSELKYPEPFNVANEDDNSIVYWWIVDTF